MKAIRVLENGGPEVLRYEDVTDPKPGPGEALVRLAAVGINFIDVYRRTGMYPVPKPFIPGTEGAGTITALGDGVSGLAVGDRVAYEGPLGAYAELQAVPAAKLVKIPDGVATDVAAAVLLQGMTAHYLAKSTFPLQPGMTCLIHAAAGGVGGLLVQIAKKLGARVIGTVGSAAKAEIARGDGADETIDYTIEDVVARVKAFTKHRGVDVVYDSVGKTTFDASLDCLRPRGYMVLFGASSGAVPPLDPQILNRKGSLYLTRPTLGNYTATREEMVGRVNDLFSWIKAGQLTVRIAHEFPLKDAAEAQRALESRRMAGKILLVP
ncbi:MAG TPA: quinone oxidoreductase [Gemmatimonadaceae bacterium]|nr:quinone oxidoreductase [Gemmatimonadaceae bacterium]